MRRRLLQLVTAFSLLALIVTWVIWLASYRDGGIEYSRREAPFMIEGNQQRRYVSAVRFLVERGVFSIRQSVRREPGSLKRGQRLQIEPNDVLAQVMRMKVPLWPVAICFAILPLIALRRRLTRIDSGYDRTAPSGDAARVSNDTSTISAWEAAYQRFETPGQEVAKFIKRLRQVGAESWPREAQIVEIFCGRGNGLVALDRMGFANLEGVDLSHDLLSNYTGPARTWVRDCRQLPFDDASRDILIVQGGLHHLPTLPDDLEQTLNEVKRVLRPGGRFMVVEPWLTPFLRAVHFASERAFVRAMSQKFDALHTMIVHEQRTYDQWLAQPDAILTLLDERFERERVSASAGKLMYLGRRAG